MSKKPNHLAALLDHQAAAKNSLPSALAKQLGYYQSATKEVKQILADCLPQEVIDTCQVVALTPHQITLSVHSTTAANHIKYLQTDYLTLLKEASFTFSQLKIIRVIVTAPLPYLQPKCLYKDNENIVKNAAQPEKQRLPKTTRENITQVATHVITDETLKKSLLKLAK